MARPSLRQKIVDAALERFLAQGFNGCSVQDITDAAGAPKGSFYNHFKTKEALALEVLGRYFEPRGPAVLDDRTRPPIERLRGHFQQLAERHGAAGCVEGCMIANFGIDMAETSPAMRAALTEALARQTETVARVLGEAGYPPAEAGQLAGFLINAWEGAMIRMRIEKSRQPLDLFLGVVFDRLLASGKIAGCG